jgi:hypothetical protein
VLTLAFSTKLTALQEFLDTTRLTQLNTTTERAETTTYSTTPTQAVVEQTFLSKTKQLPTSTYTHPYQPNQAALNNLYGIGDGCSAYGNRNFWRIFTGWFGSTYNRNAFNWSLVSQQAFMNPERSIRFSSSTTVAPGQKIYMRIVARNNGSKIWDQSFLRLGTSRNRDRTSMFSDASWVHPVRPTGVEESSVLPGQEGTFLFELTAPQQTGSYKEYFNLVAEARTWLNDLGLYYPINVVEPVAPRDNINVLNSGQSLNLGQNLLSTDNNSVLAFQPNGNLSLIQNFRTIWTSNTSGRGGTRVVMQTDGNLVMYDQQNIAVWHTRTPGNTNNPRLILQTDGNLVLYSGTSALWHTNSVHRPDLLGFVNIGARQAVIYPGQRLETANRNYRLVLQGDGNLVLYSRFRALWSSRTVGEDISHLAMQSDGNFVLYNKGNRAVWHTRTNSNNNSRIVVQTDGNLVIYNSSNRPIWHTRTNGLE